MADKMQRIRGRQIIPFVPFEVLLSPELIGYRGSWNSARCFWKKSKGLREGRGTEWFVKQCLRRDTNSISVARSVQSSKLINHLFSSFYHFYRIETILSSFFPRPIKISKTILFATKSRDSSFVTRILIQKKKKKKFCNLNSEFRRIYRGKVIFVWINSDLNSIYLHKLINSRTEERSRARYELCYAVARNKHVIKPC